MTLSLSLSLSSGAKQRDLPTSDLEASVPKTDRVMGAENQSIAFGSFRPSLMIYDGVDDV